MGTDEAKDVNLTTTVLSETKVDGGIETRILKNELPTARQVNYMKFQEITLQYAMRLIAHSILERM